MNSLFVYSRTFCRGEEETDMSTIEVADVARAFELSLEGDADKCDDFSDEMYVKYGADNYRSSTLLSEIIMMIHDKEGITAAQSNFIEFKTFGIVAEETTFGVAPTLKEAKLAYLDGE